MGPQSVTDDDDDVCVWSEMYDDDDDASDGGMSEIVEFGSVASAVSGNDTRATRVNSLRADEEEEVCECTNDGVVFD